MKKILLILAIGIVCTLVITGCSSTSPTTSTAQTNTTTTTQTQATRTTSQPVSTTTPAAGKTTGAVTPPPASASASKYGGTVKWVEAIGPTTPIGWPAECSGPSGLTPQIALQTLLKEQYGGAIKPGLAASYEVVTDTANPSITFHLQKGVKFSDGTDFNAKAVKWNLDQIKASSLYASNSANWKSIDVVDDFTIRVTFKTWLNTILPDFCGQLTNQISPAAYDKNGIDWIRWHLVGTGPFLQSNFQRDVSVTATKNPDYWEKGKPYLDGFQYLFVGDELTRLALFKSGGANVLQTNGNGRMANELKDAGYNIISMLNGPNVLVPDSANADSPWSNLKVRQAAEYAIDKEAIAKTFGFGWWKAVYQYSNPGSISFDSTLTPRKYDVNKAKQLLSEAGYPSGFKTALIANPLQLNKDVVLAIQAQLAKVGIQAETQFPETAKWTEISTNTWKNAILYSTVFDRGNMNLSFNYFLGVPATTWKSVVRPTEWKATLDASKATMEQDAALLKKLEKMVDDNVLCIPIIAGSNIWAMANNVKDSGQGTRGAASWIEPQDTWLSK